MPNGCADQELEKTNMKRVPHLLLLGLGTGLWVACAPQVRDLDRIMPAMHRDSAMFVIRIGQDTSRYMWIVREGPRLSTVSANRIPVLRVLRGETLLDANDAVLSLEQQVFDPASADPDVPLTGTRIRTNRDSTVIDVGLEPNTRTIAYDGRGQFINTSHYYETLAAIHVSRLATGDSLVGQHFAGTLFPPQRFVVRREGVNEATAWSRPLGVVRLRLGQRGEITHFDGAGTSALNFTGTRVPWRDVDSTIAALLRLERAGARFGVLSPRDTVNASLAAARILIDYGRPLKRGRAIFGNIVPWDTIWRTGANVATHFTTDRDLEFAGKVLPQGKYTLWTLPSQRGWTLIFNAQTGQWGTEYDPARDVLRVAMTTTTLEHTVEQFTIVLEPRDGGGVLRLRWDRTETWIAFSVQ